MSSNPIKEIEKILKLERAKPSVNTHGSIIWTLPDGTVHRDYGPAMVAADGSFLYYQEGKRHRSDGPAIEEPDGSKYFYKLGQLHRVDGPAIIFPNGIKEYWVEGVFFTEEEFNLWQTPRDINLI